MDEIPGLRFMILSSTDFKVPSDEKAMSEIADKAVRGRLPVRKVEELVRAARPPKGTEKGAQEGNKGGKANGPEAKSPAIKDLEARLMRKLGTKVEVRDRGGRGELTIAYASLDELDRLLAVIGA